MNNLTNADKQTCVHGKPRRGSATSAKVLKAMSLFTGVESVGIICSMVKAKLIALWLGAVGTGLFGIFNTTIETAAQLTSLGLRHGVVRDVAMGAREGESALRRIIRRVRSWSVLAGVLGCGVLMAFAWPLAEIIFEDGGMWWNFALLAGVLLLNALSNGEAAIFQGTENFRRMARAGIWTALVGLIVSIPLFRFLGYASVAISFLVYSLCTLIFTFALRNKQYRMERPSAKALKEEHSFVRLGLWMSAAGFVASACQLAFATWLNREASTAEVGLYTAAITIVIRYTSLVFNSVTLEYFPRVSANISNMKRVEVFMNHEMNLLLLLFTPLVLLFLILRGPVVMLLYDSAFMGILPLLSMGIMTTLLRSVSNTMAYTILSKGEGKIYMIMESVDALLGLGLNILFYSLMGLTGIGVALLTWHGIYMLMSMIICRTRYGLAISGRTALTIFATFATAAVALVLVFFVPTLPADLLMGAGAIVYVYLFIGFLRKRRRRHTPAIQ